MSGLAAVAEALTPWFRERLEAAAASRSSISGATPRGGRGRRTRWTSPGARPRRASSCVRGYAVRVEPHDGLLAPYDIDGQYRLHRAVLDHSDVPMAGPLLARARPVRARDAVLRDGASRGRRPRAVARQGPDDLPHRRGAPRDRPPVRRHRGAHPRRSAGDAADARPARRRRGATRRHPLAPGSSTGRATTRTRSSSTCRSCATRSPGCAPTSPARAVLTLCHGDYRIGNFMLARRHRSTASSTGSWRTSPTRSRTSRTRACRSSGAATRCSRSCSRRDEYFARYEERTGLRVDPEVFHFWTVLGLVKAAASHLRGSRAFEEGRIGDLRLAAMGHQVQYVLRHIAGARAGAAGADLPDDGS